jgi:hypothetical protein
VKAKSVRVRTECIVAGYQKLFSFLGLRPSNLSGMFTFSRRAFGAMAGGGSECTARIGPSRCRRSWTVMLSGSLQGPLGSSSFPSSLSCSSSSVPSFSLGPPLGGVGSPRGAAGLSCSCSSGGLSGSEGGLRVRWVVEKGVRWVPHHGCEFERLCAHFGD